MNDKQLRRDEDRALATAALDVAAAKQAVLQAIALGDSRTAEVLAAISRLAEANTATIQAVAHLKDKADTHWALVALIHQARTPQAR